MTVPAAVAGRAAVGGADAKGLAAMRFTVDGWDPTYGTSMEVEDDLGESTAFVDVDVELPAGQWRPLDPRPDVVRPTAMLFVDGVRRIEARVWIDDATSSGAPATEASAALCASYAAGVVCCCEGRAHVLTVETRRGLFTTAPHAVDVVTSAGTYRASYAKPSPVTPSAVTLSAALQRSLAEVELTTSVAARAALGEHGVDDGTDLLVVDGPLRGRTHLPRAVGFIKSHRTAYLPTELHAMVGTLPAGQRTPVFRMGTSWDRYAWYLRLPCLPGAPWAGIVRVECSPEMTPAAVIGLAATSQVSLLRYASQEYKDARAPQNLYPIAGLERELRRRLGDSRLLHRALLRAARAGP